MYATNTMYMIHVSDRSISLGFIAVHVHMVPVEFTCTSQRRRSKVISMLNCSHERNYTFRFLFANCSKLPSIILE